MKHIRRWQVFLFGIIAVLLILFVLLALFHDRVVQFFFRPTESSIERAAQSDEAELEVIADDLAVPWDIAFLPSGDMLVTERGGTVRVFGEQNATYDIADVHAAGESGLHGVAVHPDFAQTRLIYLYKTTSKDGQTINQVERYRLDDGLHDRTVIVDDIPGAQIHDGGRIAFGPDGYLYVTTGDASTADAAQDRASLAGKILRVTADGGIPEDNPFGNLVYSYGHRNPQGITWDDAGQLWATEHGPNAQDELNFIKAGNNYGWPVITGDETAEGMKSPVRQSGINETWAPSGVAYAGGNLFFGGLRGQTLYEAVLGGSGVRAMKAHFSEDYGRIRAVVHHDGSLYFATSNLDGRGTPQERDDRIVRMDVEVLQE